jgi:hypothetical protein
MHARSEFISRLRALPDTPVAWTGDRPDDEDARLVREIIRRLDGTALQIRGGAPGS